MTPEREEPAQVAFGLQQHCMSEEKDNLIDVVFSESVNLNVLGKAFFGLSHVHGNDATGYWLGVADFHAYNNHNPFCVDAL